MGPLNVLSLADAKAYLKVDFADDDALITSLISTAVAQVEKITEYRLYQRVENPIYTSKFCYTAFQYPLNSASVVAQDSSDTNVYTVQLKYETLRTELFWGNGFGYINAYEQFYSNDFYNIKGCNVTYLLTLNVGYADPTQIPQDLITAVQQTIVFLYENRDLTKLTLPDNIMLLLAPYKRFNYVL